MSGLTLAFVAFEAALAAALGLYGLHRCWLVLAFVRLRRRADPTPPATFAPLPRVTVQLPMFNEPAVAERIIDAARGLDYPRELLQIQVLDDSTGDAAELVKRACDRRRAEDSCVELIHRGHREGYKAGALADGLKTARGEFIAIFDADFIPPRDFLRRAIHHFTDASIGMVQGRWSHLNRDHSLLTQVQAMLIDGHFVVEQAVRAATGRWFNFNGTAGIWRRSCIDDAGGWRHDTLTEDTDLSYRAQLRGWRFRFLSELTCPAELPPTVGAFVSQQRRWNKGLMQTAMKLLPAILASRAPTRTKAEAWVHLTSPVLHVLVVLLVAGLTAATLVPALSSGVGRWFDRVWIGGVLIPGLLAASAYYVMAQTAQGRPASAALARIPALLAAGVGLSVVNAAAALEALAGRGGPFVRTPKFNGKAMSDPDPLATSGGRGVPAGLIECTLAGLALLAFGRAISASPPTIGSPFLLLFACGLAWIGWPRVLGWVWSSRLFAPMMRDRCGAAAASRPAPPIVLMGYPLHTPRRAHRWMSGRGGQAETHHAHQEPDHQRHSTGEPHGQHGLAGGLRGLVADALPRSPADDA